MQADILPSPERSNLVVFLSCSRLRSWRSLLVREVKKVGASADWKRAREERPSRESRYFRKSEFTRTDGAEKYQWSGLLYSFPVCTQGVDRRHGLKQVDEVIA